MVINGIILVNKEKGISSNSVVNKVKHLINADKAGHLGTLDVLGEGLLPVSIGKGTKLFNYFLNKDKVYRTIYKFGETTDTLDLEGEITDKNDVEVTADMILKIIPEFIGKQSQMPPKYSAKKINGKTAYSLARGGVDFELKPKEIEIYSIKLIKQVEYNTFEFEIHCGSGTYIRSICRDMASKMSTFGVMSYIQRTKCGGFHIKNSYTLDDIRSGNYSIISLDDLFDFQSVDFGTQLGDKLLNGCEIEFSNKDSYIKAYKDGIFLGVCNVKNNKAKLELRLV